MYQRMTIMLNILNLNIFSTIIALLVGVYAYVKLVAFQYWKNRNVPYIQPTFPFGNIEAPYRRTMHSGDKILVNYNIAKSKGWTFFGSYNLTRPVFIPIHLDLVKAIMTKDFHSFSGKRFYVNEKDEPIGAHLFALSGVKWRNLRTKFTPAFTSGKMRMMFQALVDCGVLLDKTIKNLSAEKVPVDIKNVLGCFSTDIIGSCAFGLEVDSINHPESPFRVYGKRIFERTSWENLKIFLAIFFHGFGRLFGICLVPKEVATFFSNVVKDTVEYREKNKVTRKDFLQILIDIKNNPDPDAKAGDGKILTMDEIIAQCFVFFLAGFETSSTTMTFVLLELARNPGIQDKVREEIHSVLKKHDDKMDYDSLKDMVYMQQVIDETLRLHPPVAFVSRLCTETYKIPGKDVVIEKDTSVIIPIKAIHHDNKYYPDPEKFDPDRFTEEQKQKRHQYAYLPFGEGPRICIGMRFGLMQTKVGLTTILRNYRVSLSDKTKLPIKLDKSAIFSTVEGGVWLNIERI